jgi:PleD family two-component response regulator
MSTHHELIHYSKDVIMVVDDTPENIELLSQILMAQGYEVFPVSNGKLALKGVETALPDLILLDIRMPDMDGYEVCQHLKANIHTKDIPVIFISALDDLADKVRGFKVGGIDYITKPFQLAEVLIRVKTHLAVRHLQEQLQIANEKLAEQLQESERLNTELQQRNAELQESLRTIKTLSGLVPICAWCHKTIRDDKGTWMALEAYIEDHSEAKFTHGMCPDCLERFKEEN